MRVSENEQCWICDKWIYSLVFFNPNKNNRQLDEIKQEQVIKQLKLFDPKMEESFPSYPHKRLDTVLSSFSDETLDQKNET